VAQVVIAKWTQRLHAVLAFYHLWAFSGTVGICRRGSSRKSLGWSATTMTDDINRIIITARKVRTNVGPTYLSVFETEVRVPGALDTVWPEAHGTLDNLKSYLLGLKTVLVLAGYAAFTLEWNLDPQWELPAGLRWTILRHGPAAWPEQLDRDGEVIPDV
jgi:hypothetical protein